MSKKRTISLLFVAAMLVLVVGASLALGSSSLAALGRADAASPQAAVGSGFTYQGRLTDGGGNPINDTCDLDFTLWDAENGGSVVGHQFVTDTVVTDGYLTVLLNDSDQFGADAFTGEARWLKIGVKCSADAGWNFLSGRQLLSAAPYALSLRPGATVSGAVSGGPVLKVVNQTGNTALYAQGDVAQNAGAAGLVKAAVYVECKGHLPPPPHRYFNTVSDTVTSLDVGYFPVAGTCVLDFDFDLSQRFWIAMAYNDTNATTVSCTLNTVNNNRLTCKRWDKDGNLVNGDIMVLVY